MNRIIRLVMKWIRIPTQRKVGRPGLLEKTPERVSKPIRDPSWNTFEHVEEAIERNARLSRDYSKIAIETKTEKAAIRRRLEDVRQGWGEDIAKDGRIHETTSKSARYTDPQGRIHQRLQWNANDHLGVESFDWIEPTGDDIRRRRQSKRISDIVAETLKRHIGYVYVTTDDRGTGQRFDLTVGQYEFRVLLFRNELIAFEIEASGERGRIFQSEI